MRTAKEPSNLVPKHFKAALFLGSGLVAISYFQQNVSHVFSSIDRTSQDIHMVANHVNSWAQTSSARIDSIQKRVDKMNAKEKGVLSHTTARTPESSSA